MQSESHVCVQLYDISEFLYIHVLYEWMAGSP